LHQTRSRPTEGEDILEQRDGQIAAVTNITANADDEDEGDDGQFTGIVQVNFLSHHQRDTLNADDAIKVDGEATGHRGRDAVDGIAQRADEAEDNGDNAGGENCRGRE